MNSAKNSRPASDAATILCGTFRGLLLALVVASTPLSAFSAEADASWTARTTPLEQLWRDVRVRNPEIAAARQELEGAQQRIAPAHALEDPMLEVGVVNAPLNSMSLRREDMTMIMLGLTQRLPFPGKRDLRAAVARMDADSVKFAYEETVNRVMRDARAAYFDLVLVQHSRDIVLNNREVVEQFLHVAEARYGVGQGTQADVLKAQTQLSGMSDELLLNDREEAAIQAQLRRLRDDASDPTTPIRPTPLPPMPRTLNIEISALRQAAIRDRPQLRGLQSLIERNDQEVALLQRDFYPDFDVRLSYGQRERTLDGARRDDMVSLTIAVNLPIWRKNRIEPRITEALAMRNRTRELYRAQTAEVLAALDTQFATALQSRLSADLIEAGLLPQSRLAVESSLAAYRVGRVDFSTLLDNQMIVYRYELERARTAATYARALAEIDFLVGKAPE